MIELKKEIKWNSFEICIDGNTYTDDGVFEITSDDFLIFSESRYKERLEMVYLMR
ncbi:hypothetical protein QNH26_09430 [Peribacillus frigoritolerans]|uniref:hypothetical protein n=1 Tax=Peribacillus frigoritolerans TaxID=450367 RepID=UPI0024C1340D|nr:hypothetical protein [Peribacillus frigoritolerans]WHX68770.1 hypothetical protein QNH26_09430 [Peribacillus frigoritolerans]